MLPGFHHRLEQEQAPAFFARGPSPMARLVFFSALSLILIATDARFQYLVSLRQHLIGILHPLQVVANFPSQLFRDTNAYFSTHHYLLKENQRLAQQALAQDIALQRLKHFTHENEHLRSLLQANASLVETSMMGEILHFSRDPFTKKVVVNRGTHHHVVTGAAVVDATGVIGQVTRVYPMSSEVTLITDKSLAIPVQVERNGLRAIAFGHGRNNTLDLPYLPANVDMRQGDTLVTSGIDGVYPAGLAVATISSIETSADSPFAHIVCKPTGGVENHRQVLIVSIPNVELTTTIGGSKIIEKNKGNAGQSQQTKTIVTTPSDLKNSTATSNLISAQPSTSGNSAQPATHAATPTANEPNASE